MKTKKKPSYKQEVTVDYVGHSFYPFNKLSCYPFNKSLKSLEQPSDENPVKRRVSVVVMRVHVHYREIYIYIYI